LNEEIGELNQLSLQKEVAGTDWDAKTLRIKNVPTATDTTDAVNKTYVDTQISNQITGSSTASAKYAFTGDGSTAFTFSPAIALGDDTMYEVAIDGVLQEPTVAYAIDADANTITFTGTPPTSSKIVVVQRGYAIPVAAIPVSTSQIEDDAVTSSKISDTDSVFMVDDTSAQKTVVINEGGGDVDFRVEGDNNANLIATDAANDVVGVNVTSLDVSSTFNTADKYNLQVSKGLLIKQDSDQARLHLQSTDAVNGSCMLRLESAAHTGTNEGMYSIYTGGGSGKFNITNERASKTLTMDADGAWYPSLDYDAVTNTAQSSGLASKRWSVVYANSSVITTSDRNEKEQIEDLSEAELRVATAIKGLVKKFKFKGRLRTHVGVIAQDVKDAFNAEGLDATEYGLFCSDTWTDEETGEEKTRLGIRYEELLAFIIASI
jgi:hypothetical protein